MMIKVNGEMYVEFEDYKDLEAENKRLREVLKRVMKATMGCLQVSRQSIKGEE